jgi:lactoylglutathione lyase
MRYLHTMVRVKDLDASLDFYTTALGLQEIRRFDNEQGRYTLVFLAASDDLGAAKENMAPCVELTYNWDTEDYQGGRNFGHLAYEVDNIYETCQQLQDKGITINRPPREGRMAFVRSPDGISIELLQKGDNLPVSEPWASAPNIGSW